MDRLRSILILVGAILLANGPPFATARAAGVQNQEGSYLAVIRQELARLQLLAQCDDARSECALRMSCPRSPEHQFNVTVRCSPQTATVHMFIEDVIPVDELDGPSQGQARGLLELNAQLVTAKLEWQPHKTGVRLSTFVGTDSNFDRAAFRAQLLALVEAADAVRLRMTAAPASSHLGANTP